MSPALGGYVILQQLAADEWRLMEEHSAHGERIVKRIPGLADVASVVRHHHERYDGSGYPDGLVGDEIPLEARIVAVADVFDALISPRPYKKAWDVDAALGYMYAQRGRLFDPRCVDALIRSRARLDEICQRYSTSSTRPGLE